MRGCRSSVTLGNSLDFVLLPDSERSTRGSLGGVDELVSKGLLDALQRAEGGFTGTLDDQIDSLVDSAEGGDVDCLSAHGTT